MRRVEITEQNEYFTVSGSKKKFYKGYGSSDYARAWREGRFLYLLSYNTRMGYAGIATYCMEDTEEIIQVHQDMFSQNAESDFGDMLKSGEEFFDLSETRMRNILMNYL